MRHRKIKSRLGRMDAHRKATFSLMARNVFKYQGIKTTAGKAKEARRVVEKLITLAKVDSIAARRRAFSVLKDDDIVRRLFKEIVPLFKSRPGGYTRVIPLSHRRGDGASMVLLELTERVQEEEKPKKKKKVKEKKPAAVTAEEPVKEKVKEKKPVEEVKTPAPEITPEVKEEKVVEDVKKEKAKKETKKIEKKGFFKRFFRRRTNM